MARGRKRKSDELKQLAGNPGKRPIVTYAEEFGPPMPRVVLPSNCPVPPSWLDSLGVEQWILEWPRLDGLYLKDTDLTGFAIYCAAVSRFRQAKAVIDQLGLTYSTVSGYVRERPEVKILEKAERTIRSFLDALASNPLARLRAGSIQASRQLNLPLAGEPKPQQPGASSAPAPAKDPNDPVGHLVH